MIVNLSVFNHSQDVGWMLFYFRKDVKSSKEYFIYSVPVTIAEIGGYMGLLLGISLFDLSLGIDYILELYFRNKKIASSEETASKHVNQSRDDGWTTNDMKIRRPFGLRKILQGILEKRSCHFCFT